MAERTVTANGVEIRAGEAGYGGADLGADAAGVLDGYGIPAAHVVGL